MHPESDLTNRFIMWIIRFDSGIPPWDIKKKALICKAKGDVHYKIYYNIHPVYRNAHKR